MEIPEIRLVISHRRDIEKYFCFADVIYHNYVKQRAYISESVANWGPHYVARKSAQTKTARRGSPRAGFYSVTFPAVANSGSLRE